MLLLDATDPLAAGLVDLYDELTLDSKVMPLLVVAALDINAATDAPVHDVDRAAPALRSLVNREKTDPSRRLVLRLPQDAPTDPVAEAYLPTHRRVRPKIPGRVSALAPLVVTLLLLTASGGFAAYQYFGSGCADTKINALGERVGLIESDCSFEQPSATPGVPNLADLEQAVFDNNAAVDRLRDENNEKRYYREVVFFGPLTRPATAERTAPPNSIWQLLGAVEAQRRHNDDANRDMNLVPIKLILANSGDRFADGDWVAAKIAERPQLYNGELAAVIGISQSRQAVSNAIRDHLKDIPVIGASMYGSRMTENDNMFLSAPLNKAFAVRMANWLKDQGYDSTAAVVYDPDDVYYSRELHDLLRAEGIGSTETDVKIKESDSADITDRNIAEMCDNTDRRIPVLTNRADQILKFLDRAKNIDDCRRADPMPILAGPGLIVEAATGTLAERYPWTHVTMTSLANTAAKSEESTGRDAFRIAAVAIREAQTSAKGEWRPTLARSMLLGKPEAFEILGLPRLNDYTDIERIKLIDIVP